MRKGQPLPFWDEHSLDEQRFYNVACWLYGALPGPFAGIVGYQWLPVDRAEKCPDEYKNIATQATRMLGAHMVRPLPRP